MLSRLPEELFGQLLAFVAAPSNARAVNRRWLYALGREYRRRVLHLQPLLADAIALGLLVPSWYRLHQALTAGSRGLQIGRRMNIRRLMTDEDAEADGLREFTLLVRLTRSRYKLVRGSLTWHVSHRTQDYDHRLATLWPNYDGSFCRIPLPSCPVVAILPHPSDLQVCADEWGSYKTARCSGIWPMLMDEDCWNL